LGSVVFRIPKVFISFRTAADSVDVPFTDLINDATTHLAEIPRDKPVFVICRFGNDSQIAVEIMKKCDKFLEVRDIKGGLNAWAETYPTDVIPKY
jgi:adenylyltransferase/sulfurtransferase